MNKTAIVLCQCKSENYQDIFFDQALELLADFETDVFTVHDFCAAALKNGPELREIAKTYGRKIVLACHPRAVKHILAQNNIDFGKYECVNYRDKSIDQIEKEIQILNMPSGKAIIHKIKSSLNVPSWYPVIDRDRCTSCAKCAKFCVFGVYRIKDGIVHVHLPLNCKNNCPACARSCPSKALIFPKIEEGGIVAGAEDLLQKQDPNIERDYLSAKLTNHDTIRSSLLKPALIQKVKKSPAAKRTTKKIKRENTDD